MAAVGELHIKIILFVHAYVNHYLAEFGKMRFRIFKNVMVHNPSPDVNGFAFHIDSVRAVYMVTQISAEQDGLNSRDICDNAHDSGANCFLYGQ